MKPWPIIRLTATHCLQALVVSGIFGATFYLMRRFCPDSSVVWWFGNIDLMLQVIVAVVLALAFLNALLRILADLVITTWRGFPNGDRHFLLV